MNPFLRNNCKLIIFSSIILVFCILIALFVSISHSNSETNFKSYYEIDFEKVKRELFDTKGQEPNPLFDDLIPAHVNKYSSFVITAERGSGKSRIWANFRSNLSENHFVIEPLKQTVPLINAIKIWTVNRMGELQSSANDYFKQNWGKSELIDFVIQTTALKIINDTNRIIPAARKLENGERLKLASLLCLYGSEDNGLVTEAFVKQLFNEETKANLDGQVKCSNEEKHPVKEYLNKIHILQRDNEWKVNILCSLIKTFDTRLSNVLVFPAELSEMSQAWFILLIDIIGSKLGIPVLVGFDGFDDISNFNILPNNCGDPNFATFIKSLAPLLEIATSCESKIFKVMIFIPKCPAFPDIRALLPEWKEEKVHHIEMKWDEKNLIKYGDFIMRELKKYQNGSISWSPFSPKFWKWQLPEKFLAFIGGPNCAKKFLKGVTQPRSFNDRLVEFITQLNTEATNFFGSKDCNTIS